MHNHHLITDHYLNHYADIFTKNATLRSQMTFDVFLQSPDQHLEQIKNWPKVIWHINFADVLMNQRMWVLNGRSNKILLLSEIGFKQQQQIPIALNKLTQRLGNPDFICVEKDASQSCALVRTWARKNGVGIKLTQEAS